MTFFLYYSCFSKFSRTGLLDYHQPNETTRGHTNTSSTKALTDIGVCKPCQTITKFIELPMDILTQPLPKSYLMGGVWAPRCLG